MSSAEIMMYAWFSVCVREREREAEGVKLEKNTHAVFSYAKPTIINGITIFVNLLIFHFRIMPKNEETLRWKKDR